MERMKMESANFTDQNIDKIAALFPNCITEASDGNGGIKKAVNFDLLRQMLSEDVVEGDEAYEFTWVGKKAAIVEANKPIRKTLRPCPAESVDWDHTENLYIEGDNLEVLKLLQESYLGKVKMIYIDPPYNTGNDFVYRDNFALSNKDYEEESGAINDEGERLFKNTDTNGRFHSDWCSMMYSRLMLARNLLRDDGVIFISIDDNEQENLKKICDEIFGERNFESTIKWRRRSNQPNDASKMIAKVSEYIYVYAKNSIVLKEKNAFGTVDISAERLAAYSNPDNDPRGEWSTKPWCAGKGQGGTRYKITTPQGKIYDEVWLGSQKTYESLLRDNRIWFTSDGNGKPRKKIFKNEASERGQSAIDFLVGDAYGDNLEATSDMKKLFENDRIFDYPKSVKLIRTFVRLAVPKLFSDGICLDFFSGSATTAHAVMQLNAEDGGHRKFIMVQLPEACDENSEAYKAGYKNICEIGKERIRRAGKKIKEESPLTTKDLDTGFRVFKLDDSNMKDVYYSAGDYTQDLLSGLESNIKEDRTDLDLLFGCLLKWGLPLSMPYRSENIDGFTVHTYNDGDLIACFDENIPDSVVKTIAQRQPLRAVFRDSSFADSPSKINVGEIFKLLAPDTRVKVI